MDFNNGGSQWEEIEKAFLYRTENKESENIGGTNNAIKTYFETIKEGMMDYISTKIEGELKEEMIWVVGAYFEKALEWVDEAKLYDSDYSPEEVYQAVKKVMEKVEPELYKKFKVIDDIYARNTYNPAELKEAYGHEYIIGNNLPAAITKITTQALEQTIKKGEYKDKPLALIKKATKGITKIIEKYPQYQNKIDELAYLAIEAGMSPKTIEFWIKEGASPENIEEVVELLKHPEIKKRFSITNPKERRELIEKIEKDGEITPLMPLDEFFEKLRQGVLTDEELYDHIDIEEYNQEEE